MNNDFSQLQDSKEKTHTQHYGAHSGSRAGLSDYHDGGKISHYGGNDDTYPSEENDEEVEENDLDGKVAYGNDNESDDEDEYGKYHSGL